MKINPPEKLEQIYNIRTTRKTANKIKSVAKRMKVKQSVLIRLILTDWAETYK